MAEATADDEFVPEGRTYRAQIEAANEQFCALMRAAGYRQIDGPEPDPEPHEPDPEPQEPDPVPEWQRIFIAQNLLGEGGVPVRKYPSVMQIVHVVSAFYGVDPHDVLSERRTAKLIIPRHVAMYLARALTLKSYPYIGRVIGDRDHTTVLHGVRKIERQLGSDQDSALARNIAAIRGFLDEGHAAQAHGHVLSEAAE